MGITREATSSGSGAYDIPELPIGVYRVAFSAPGFREAVFESLEEAVGQTRTLDVAMSIAGSSQRVDVNGTRVVRRNKQPIGKAALVAASGIHVVTRDRPGCRRWR
jgi:hypothetical protein